MKVSSKEELVTPEQAAEWLAQRNTRNRPKNERAIIALAKDITEGRWITSHQGIAFGEDGSLLDGQHRLSAIVLSGVAVRVMVTRNLPLEARDIIDLGGAGTRRAQDVMAITDGVHISSNVRAWIYYAEGVLADGSGAAMTHWPKLTVDALRRGWVRHGPHVQAVVLTLNEKTPRISKAPVASAFVIAHRIWPEATEAMATQVASGADLSDGDPALALRNRLLLGRADFSPIGKDDINASTFGAIENYIKGVSLRMARRNDGARARILTAWREMEEATPSG